MGARARLRHSPQSTRERYASVYSVHIAPWLDDVPTARADGGSAASLADRADQGRRRARARSTSAGRVLSSVLRHAAESEAIAANPLSLVRAPKSEHRDAVVPLSPATVEKLRAIMGNPATAGGGRLAGRAAEATTVRARPARRARDLAA